MFIIQGNERLEFQHAMFDTAPYQMTISPIFESCLKSDYSSSRRNGHKADETEL